MAQPSLGKGGLYLAVFSGSPVQAKEYQVGAEILDLANHLAKIPFSRGIDFQHIVTQGAQSVGDGFSA
jgi:hypothetical protein